VPVRENDLDHALRLRGSRGKDLHEPEVVGPRDLGLGLLELPGRRAKPQALEMIATRELGRRLAARAPREDEGLPDRTGASGVGHAREAKQAEEDL
jgi:hypothetical protein